GHAGAHGGIVDADRGLQRVPGTGLGAGDDLAGEHLEGVLAGELLEVELEVEQRGGPAVLGALAAESEADDAHDAGAAGASLDQELGRLRAVVLDEAQPARRVEVGDLGRAGLAGQVVEGDVAVHYLGGQEPGADAVRGGDRLPHLLGCGFDLDLHLEAGLLVCGHRSSSSGMGWAAASTRYGSPASSWWRDVSSATAAASSSANAARASGRR